MKSILLALGLVLLLVPSGHSGPTNNPTAATVGVTVDASGNLLAPANFFTQNASNLAAAASSIPTTNTAAKLWQGSNNFAGQVIATNTASNVISGTLSGPGSGITSLSAGNLTGTLPNGTFPATLPAASGANLTSLPAGNLTGTLPNGVFPATIPAASGANLTALPAGNLTGTLPNGVFPATLPAASGANLTSLPAANLTGSLPALNGAALTSLNVSTATGNLTTAYPSNDMTMNLQYIEPEYTTNFVCPLTGPNAIENFSVSPLDIPITRVDAHGNISLDEDNAGGFIWFQFSPPTGSTSVTVSASVSSIGSSTTVAFGLRDAANNVKASQSFTVPSGSFSAISTNYSFTGGTNLVLAIIPSGPMTISNLSMTFSPTPTNVGFANAAYKRYEILPHHVQRTLFMGKPNGDQTTEEGVVSMLATGPVTLMARTTSTTAGMAVSVNGSAYTNWYPSGATLYSYLDLPLVGNNRIDVQNSFNAGPWSIWQSLSAVFCATTNSVYITSAQPLRRLLIYGDSIVSGINWTNNGSTTLAKQIEKIYDCEVRMLASSSAELSDDLANRKGMLLRAVSGYAPSDIWIEIGRNDWNASTYANTNLFSIAYSGLVDTLHQMEPAAAIYLQTPIPQTSSETGSGQGSLGDWRNAITNIAFVRSNFCSTVLGPSIMSTSYLASDGLHPSDIGNAHYAIGIAQALWTYPNTFTNPWMYYDANGNGVLSIPTANVGTLTVTNYSTSVNGLTVTSSGLTNTLTTIYQGIFTVTNTSFWTNFNAAGTAWSTNQGPQTNVPFLLVPGAKIKAPANAIDVAHVSGCGIY